MNLPHLGQKKPTAPRDGALSLDIRLEGPWKRDLGYLPAGAPSSNEIREGLRMASGHRANRRQAYTGSGSCFSAHPWVAKMDTGQTNVRL